MGRHAEACTHPLCPRWPPARSPRSDARGAAPGERRGDKERSGYTGYRPTLLADLRLRGLAVGAASFGELGTRSLEIELEVAEGLALCRQLGLAALDVELQL